VRSDDIYLHRTYLFREKTDLAKARDIIEEPGYGRRK
jgi:hypothetical protein